MPCKFMQLARFQTSHKSTVYLQLCLLLILLLLINTTTASNQKNALNPLFQKKTHLSQTLDSLNLLKQNKKRDGLSLSEIETKEKELIDSLLLIRQKIQSNLSSSNQISKIDKNLFSLFKPLNYSDWLILSAAIAAVFFGILLLFGMVKKILFPNSKKLKKQDTIQSINLSSDIFNLENTSKTSASTSQTNSPQMPNPQIQPLEEEKNTDEKSSFDNTFESKEELEAKILKAASEGLNIQEISRLFHLSSDHVSLILRLSESHEKK